MLIMIAPPESLPVTVAEAKEALRIDDAEQDSLVEQYLRAAADIIEAEATVALVRTGYEERFDVWPPTGACLDLGRAPVREVQAVRYLDADGEEQTIDPADYSWDRTTEGAAVTFGAGFERSALAPGRPGVVRVVFEAGFDAADEVEPDPAFALPGRARAALLLLTGHFYAHREAVVVGTIASELPFGLRHAAASLRIFR